MIPNLIPYHEKGVKLIGNMSYILMRNVRGKKDFYDNIDARMSRE